MLERLSVNTVTEKSVSGRRELKHWGRNAVGTAPVVTLSVLGQVHEQDIQMNGKTAQCVLFYICDVKGGQS